MKFILSFIAATSVVLVASDTASARRWFFQPRPQVCVNQPRECLPCEPIAPCLCPQELATGPDPDLFFFQVARYNCDCRAECDAPQVTVMATDGFVEFPQLCENSPDCEFSLAALKSRGVNYVGLPAPKTPTFTPRIWDVPAADVRLIDDGCLKFYLDNTSDSNGPIEKYARYCLFRLPEHVHPIHQPTSPHARYLPRTHKARTLAIGFEIDKPSTDIVINYEVDANRVEETPHHPYVHHVDTGGVIYPIVMVQRP